MGCGCHAVAKVSFSLHFYGVAMVPDETTKSLLLKIVDQMHDVNRDRKRLDHDPYVRDGAKSRLVF